MSGHAGAACAARRSLALGRAMRPMLHDARPVERRRRAGARRRRSLAAAQAATGSALDQRRRPDRRASSLFVGLWYLMHDWALDAVFDKPSFLIPSPATVVDQARSSTRAARGDLLAGPRLDDARRPHRARHLDRARHVAGRSLMAQATWVERSFWPYLIAAQAIPILAIVPIIGIIFGFGFGSPDPRLRDHLDLPDRVEHAVRAAVGRRQPARPVHAARAPSRWTRLRKLQLPARPAGDLHRVPHRRRAVGDRRRRRRAVLPQGRQGHRHPDGPVPVAEPATRRPTAR